MRIAQSSWFTVCMATALVVTPSLRAQGVSSCVEELALPGFASYIEAPGVQDVYLTIGPDGKATTPRFSTKDPMTLAYLRAYFVTESRYSTACQGRQLHFVITYIAQGVPTDEPRYETRWRAPNELIVTYHPIKPKIR
jgi:hypothetical protein